MMTFQIGKTRPGVRKLPTGVTVKNINCACMAVAAHYKGDIDYDILYTGNVEVTVGGKNLPVIGHENIPTTG